MAFQLRDDRCELKISKTHLCRVSFLALIYEPEAAINV